MKAEKYLRMVIELDSVHPDLYRFLSKVEINKDTNCWEWKNSIRKDYGRFKFNGKFEGAHRISYLFFKGEIPEGKIVCHHCDNPKCVNPEHLFLGTYKDNAIDASEKGRLYLPDVHKHQYKNGHSPANRKLKSQDEVEKVKEMIKNRLGTLKELSEELNLPYQLIRDINSGRSYI